MKYWKSRFLTGYPDNLLLCFLGGAAGGTVIANLLSKELQSQIGYFDGWFSGGKILSGAQKVQMYWYVLRQRELEFLMAWFLTMTVFSRQGFCCLAAWTGGISAITISIFTSQLGIMERPGLCGFCCAPIFLLSADLADSCRVGTKKEKKIQTACVFWFFFWLLQVGATQQKCMSIHI